MTLVTKSPWCTAKVNLAKHHPSKYISTSLEVTRDNTGRYHNSNGPGSHETGHILKQYNWSTGTQRNRTLSLWLSDWLSRNVQWWENRETWGSMKAEKRDCKTRQWLYCGKIQMVRWSQYHTALWTHTITFTWTSTHSHDIRRHCDILILMLIIISFNDIAWCFNLFVILLSSCKHFYWLIKNGRRHAPNHLFLFPLGSSHFIKDSNS